MPARWRAARRAGEPITTNIDPANPYGSGVDYNREIADGKWVASTNFDKRRSPQPMPVSTIRKRNSSRFLTSRGSRYTSRRKSGVQGAARHA